MGTLKVMAVNATFHPSSVLCFLNSFRHENRSLLMFLEILSKVLPEGVQTKLTDNVASTISPQIKIVIIL